MGRGIHKPTRDLIEYIKENILRDERKSIRRIYYALEARQMIVSSDKNYQMVQNAIKTARFHGLIDPDQILVDKGRQSRCGVENSYTAHRVIERLENTAYWYSVNFWELSKSYVEVWQEKESVEPEFIPICRNYNVRLETGRGDQSIQVIWNAMKRWNLLLCRGKKITVLYFGDFNPSGLHAPIAIQNTIAKLSRSWKDRFDNDFSKIEFKRIGLTLEHINQYHLPQNPTKQTSLKDKVIAKRFIRKYGDINVEIESLAERNKEGFLQMIENALKDHVDEEARLNARIKETNVQPRLRKIIKEMKDDYFAKEKEIDERI